MKKKKFPTPSRSLVSQLKPVVTERFVWHVSNCFFQKDLKDYMPSIFQCFRLEDSPSYCEAYFKHAQYVRESISRNGLVLGKKEELVFANNGINDINFMFPLWLDKYAQDVYNPAKTEMGWVSVYDFWRIDTKKCEGNWFVDPFMEKDLNLLEKNELGSVVPANFVCTDKPIPVEALKLFRFNEAAYESKRSRFVFRDGSLKVISYKGVWDAIREVDPADITFMPLERAA